MRINSKTREPLHNIKDSETTNEDEAATRIKVLPVDEADACCNWRWMFLFCLLLLSRRKEASSLRTSLGVAAALVGP